MSRSAAWCLGFFGALIFYWAAATFGGGVDWMRHYRLFKHASHTQGTVTARTPKNAAHYEFEVGGKRYQSVGHGGGSVGSKATVGDKVTVFYLPDDPTFSMLKSPGEDLAFMIAAPIALSTLAGFVVLARLGRKHQSRVRHAPKVRR